jgi:hypothetical protein
VDTALARVVSVFGESRSHHAYLFMNRGAGSEWKSGAGRNQRTEERRRPSRKSSFASKHKRARVTRAPNRNDRGTYPVVTNRALTGFRTALGALLGTDY